MEKIEDIQIFTPSHSSHLSKQGRGSEQPEPMNIYFVDSYPNPQLVQDGSTNKSWIVGCRCLAKKTDNGVAICY